MTQILSPCTLLLLIVLSIYSNPLSAEPLILKQAIEEAVSNNPALLKAKQIHQMIDAEKWDKILPENPEFMTEYERIPFGQQSLSRYDERKIGIGQEFEFPLTYYYRGKYTSLEKKLSNAEYALLRNDIVSEVTKSFYNILMLREQEKFYTEVVALTQNILEKAQLRVDAGEATSYETLKAKVDYAEAENNMLEISHNYTLALYELKLAMGRRKTDTIEVQGELEFLPIPVNIDSLKQIAMLSHPLLRASLAIMDRKILDKKMLWMGIIPSFKVGYFNQNFRDSDIQNAWGSEIGLTIPLWGLFKEKGRIRAASYGIEAAGWQIESDKRKVLLAVEKNALKLEIAQDRVRKYRDETLREVEELVRISQRSYEEGEMGYLEVTEALRTMQRAKAGYYESLNIYLSAYTDLENAVGIPLTLHNTDELHGGK